MKKTILFLSVFCMILFTSVVYAQDRNLMKTDDIVNQLNAEPKPKVKFRAIKIGGAPAPAEKAVEPPQVTFDIRFKYDSTELADAMSKKQLQELAKALSNDAFANARFEIGGHTDSKGSAAYNMALSDRRADAVRNFLLDNGVASSKMSVKGYGETLPIYPNDTAEGRAKNRRVVIKRLK
ncbi:OmpA family protein [Maridesulfovibrio sp.]|uniref:OmpA family protein n=1 Tax=Maridesulfovibrio sp. TaxID=2795000 RepID=UPI0029CA6767|nr:OmpA family protein [Maridesulfovibrio sp.]